MKKSELRQIIKEEIRQILSEDYISGIFEKSAVEELKSLLSNKDYKQLNLCVKADDNIVNKYQGQLWDKVLKLDDWFPIRTAQDALGYLNQYGKIFRDGNLMAISKKYKK